MSKVLLLEDDVCLVDGLKYSLGKNGFDVTVVRTVEKALDSLPVISEYDLFCLMLHYRMEQDLMYVKR